MYNFNNRLLLVIASTVLVLCTISLAHAGALVDFRDTYVKEGIDKAVVVAMKGGANPDLIVENGMKFEGLNPQNLVKALYCAGAKGQDIRSAAEKYNISEVIVAAGYKKAVAECGDQVADSQTYIPMSNSPSAGRNGSFASPSTFIKK